MEYPFIYICSLMRTGSTFLQEALTELPYSLILSEPRFNGINFVLNKENRLQMQNAGLKIPKISNIKMFFNSLDVGQVGVKEIRNRGWKGYVEGFKGDIRVLLTGRDPRDVYISAQGVLNRGHSWKPMHGFNPKGLFKELEKEFHVQKILFGSVPSMKIKYEDLCINFDDRFKEIKKFVKSPIPEVGEIGNFHKGIPAGQYEFEKHGGRVTSKSVSRWRREKDGRLLKEAKEFFELMSDYNSFWGYK